MIERAIAGLVQYGLRSGLIEEEDKIYATNRILEVLQRDSYDEPEEYQQGNLEEILKVLLDDAWERKLFPENSVLYRDLFDTKLMACLTPAPSVVNRTFWEKYKESPKSATDYFYKLSQDTDYIRRYRIRRDVRWSVPGPYGEIELSINLSKPEKDPKAIAAAGKKAANSYPKCLLCKENVGYAGRLDHPARQNHRTVSLEIAGKPWGLQYSPYVYYPEHCILFNKEHVPMKIERETFVKLLDFITLFPHYFIGSNADLPIVGGSILSHDHYQGGCHTFAMEKAEVERMFVIPGYEDVKAGIVKWPLSVIRIAHRDKERLIGLADRILEKWRGYTDEEAVIYAYTDGEPHNTITPIARRRGEDYELDLVLRNNLTTEEYPLGIYHPHSEYHHIKKENIGLIEVMGLAVLPARLKSEMELLKECIRNGQEIRTVEKLAAHADWAETFLKKYDVSQMCEDEITQMIQTEIGDVFVHVLENAGVYKCTEEGREKFMKFIQTI